MMALYLKAAGKRAEREHEGRAWLAWHVAALSQPRKGRFPTLESLTGKRAEAKPLSWEEQREMLRSLTIH